MTTSSKEGKYIIYKMNKLNENAMRTHEHATHGMTNITFKKVIILEEANIMQLFTLLT